MTEVSGYTWVIFNLVILGLLMLDLFVFHRTAHEISTREAAIFSAFWVGVGLVFAVILYFWQGLEPATTYLTGYIIEKSLSVDNLFVFVVIFAYFAVPLGYQHRVLFWGILGVLILRGIFIFAGAALLARFNWLMYIFGGFLVFTAFRMSFQRETEVHPERNPLVKLARRVIPVTEDYEGARLFTRRAGRLMATPLFVVLLVIETTDVVFAIDSIPAIFAVTRDTFLVYTSNVFAILGLRSLYFLLARIVHKFRFLKYGLSIVLAFVGIKMLIHDFYHVPIPFSLTFITVVVGVSVIVSLSVPEKRPTSCPQCDQPLEAVDVCPACEAIIWPPEAAAAAASARRAHPVPASALEAEKDRVEGDEVETA